MTLYMMTSWLSLGFDLEYVYASDTPVHKLHLQKVEQFRLTSKSPAPYHIAAYVPGSKVLLQICS